MTDEDQLQLKKNTLWEMHETKQKIVCLERKIESSIKAMVAVSEHWSAGNLGSRAGLLVSITTNGIQSMI